MLAGEQDVGLIHHVPHPEAIETEPAFPGEPLVVYLAVGHHLADRPSITPEELYEEVLLVGPRKADPALWDHLDASLADAGYRFHDRRETAGAAVRDLLFAVAEGRGIALGPVSALTVTGDFATAVVRRSLAPAVDAGHHARVEDAATRRGGRHARGGARGRAPGQPRLLATPGRLISRSG